MTTEERIEKLSLGISTVRVILSKFNQCHVKSGPQGGQFCETKGGGSGGGAKPSETVKPTSKPPEAPKLSGDRIVVSYKGGTTVGVNPPPPSADEVKAMGDYKGLWYEPMNQTLLGAPISFGDPKLVKQRVEDFSRVMDRSRLDTASTLYRGMGGEPGRITSQLPVGSEFSIPCFQSTSASHIVAVKFADRGVPPPVVFRIQTPAGTKGLPIEHFEKIKKGDEAEVVLNKGLKYRIVSKNEEALKSGVGRNRFSHDKYLVVTMEVVK